MFAHRGFVSPELAAKGVAENTLAAFEAARDTFAGGGRAADLYLESDCHLSADGTVVLFHDATLERVLGDPRPVSEVTRSELADLLAGRGGLLTLDELLDRFPDARLNLDVKAIEAAVPAARIVARHAGRVLLTSFSEKIRARALGAAYEAGKPTGIPGGSPVASRPATSPGRNRLIRVLLAVASGSRRSIARSLTGLDALQIPERQEPIPVLTRRLIAGAHLNGVEVHVWTVNDPARMVELADMGVDGIITDRVDLALEAFSD